MHEATFEDRMEAEALVKRHSTVGEALGVGRGMGARTVVLTHFSQRYPKIPPFGGCDGDGGGTDDRDGVGGSTAPPPAVVVAFDFMRVRPGNLCLASKLTPALRLLYPAEEEGGGRRRERCGTEGRCGSGRREEERR